MRAGLVFLALLIAGTHARELQTIITGGGTCTATGSAGVDSTTENAIVEAYARAVKIGCTADSVTSMVKQMVVSLRYCAQATVDVWTRAFASCTTSEYAYGCAASEAYASKTVDALVTITTRAIARAVNSCTCDPKAYAEMTASLIVQLVASAKAHARAKVCVGPNSSASREAYAHCSAQVFAHGTAYAFAKAMISGGCTQLDATATATVDFLYQSDPYCACNGWSSSCINGRCTWRCQHDPGMYDGPFFTQTPRRLRAFFEGECEAYDGVVVGP